MCWQGVASSPISKQLSDFLACYTSLAISEDWIIDIPESSSIIKEVKYQLLVSHCIA
jgi:hypothetical protein